MKIFWLFIFLFTIKQVLALKDVDEIFLKSTEKGSLKFSQKENNAGGTDGSSTTSGASAAAKITQQFGFKSKKILDIIPLSDTTSLSNYFESKTNSVSCESKLSGGTDMQTDESCKNVTFCGFIPKNAIEKLKATRQTKANDESVLKDKTFCGEIHNNILYVFYYTEIVPIFPGEEYEDIIFSDGTTTLTCSESNLYFLYINVYSNNCLQDEVMAKLLEKCEGKASCEINLSTAITTNKDECFKNPFFVEVFYQCEQTCKGRGRGEICKQTSGNSTEKICKYGYKYVADSSSSKMCVENIGCPVKPCSINEYCDETQNKCVCKNNKQHETGSCLDNNLCGSINCPTGSTCERDASKFPECKCNDDKIFYENKCYTKEELTKIVQEKPIVKPNLYTPDLVDKVVIDPTHIVLNCKDNYEIEVVNAYTTCYGLDFADNKIIYFTEKLKEQCNGQQNCMLSKKIGDINNERFVKECQSNAQQPKTGGIFKYQYICRSTKTVTPSPNYFSQLDDANDDYRVGIFRSSMDSKIKCEGGTIKMKSAIVKAGENCKDEDLMQSLKVFCDDVTECDIGKLFTFDTYCANDSYLFVAYQCADTFKSSNNCKTGMTRYGNKHKTACVCTKPYLLKPKNTTPALAGSTGLSGSASTDDNTHECVLENTCSGTPCGKNQKCVQEGSNSICKCDDNSVFLNGECVPKTCDLLCPLDKVCVIENSTKKCGCPQNSAFADGSCKCNEGYVKVKKECRLKNKCTWPEYATFCAHKPNSTCTHENNTEEPTCKCNEHFEESSGNCVAKDYCKSHSCNGQHEKCVVQNHVAKCVCNEGFTRENGDTGTCKYINKCNDSPSVCPAHSKCVYHEDRAHECTCDGGYVMEESQCVAQDKCSSSSMCPEHSMCINVVNQDPLCLCTFNYFKRDGECVANNQCLQNNGGCPKNSFCLLENSSVKCVCKESYELKNDKCVPQSGLKALVNVSPGKNMIAILGFCGLIQFNAKDNQIIWKINDESTAYVYEYTYPQNSDAEVYLLKELFSTKLFVKKTESGNETYDDFYLNHDKCNYKHYFFYEEENTLVVA